MWRPRRIPYDIHLRARHIFECFDAGLRIICNNWPHPTTLCSQRHLHTDRILAIGIRRSDLHIIDESKIDDIDRNLRIKTALHRVPNLLVTKRRIALLGFGSLGDGLKLRLCGRA